MEVRPMLRFCLLGLVALLTSFASLATAWDEGPAPATEPAASTPTEQPATPADSRPKATHKQIRSLRPTHNGEPIHLNTYCLSPEGDILACVGGSNYTYKQDAQGNYTTEQISSDSFVQVYNPEGLLKTEWAVPFKPTAINVAPDHTIFVSGEGKIARLSAKGEILTTANIPNIGDPEKFRAEAVETAKAQQAASIERLKKQVEFAQEQSEKLNAVAEADRTASQKARLKAYERQLETYRQQLTRLEQAQPEAAPVAIVTNATNVTALAVSNEHVFVCASSVKSGGGYDVYRCDFDFANPKQVLTGLRGCCGQMDIQATADRLVTAENTKFQVGIYDEDGQSLDAFGSRDRTGGAGFGSCCNPMNVRCCANGDVLTAESSIGDIKRFNADGELLSYIGRAKISGGCKHVAIAWDEKLDRYYMMNVSDSSICVLVPLSQAPEFTEDELAAKAAKEGLGPKLVGAWKLPGTKVAAPTKRSAFAAALSNLLGAEDAATPAADQVNAQVAFERVNFSADGPLTISGGMYGQWGVSNWTWSAVRQDLELKTVDFDMETDGVQYQTFRAELLGADRIRISVLTGGQTAMTGEYVRDNGDTAAEATPPAAALEQAAPVETGGPTN
jgi:hypothetical protein